MTRQLGGCLKALLTTVALERLLPQVDPLVKVQLTLVLEAALAVATDEGLALLVDQLVEAQRVRRFERGRAFVALVRPGGAVRALLVGKQVELVGKLGRAHVTLVGLAAQMDLLVHLHAGQVGETFVTEGAGKQLFQWRIFPLPSTASPTMLPFLFDIVVTTF